MLSPNNARTLRRVVIYLALLLLLLVGAWVFPAQPTFGGNAPSARTVFPEKLKAHVKTISEEFAPRDYMKPAGLDRCAEYIMEHLKKAGARTSFQEFTADGTVFRNVRGCFGAGNGPRIVVGAHYDACEGFPGADDNASGIAGLLELAELLKDTPNLPAVIELVAFANEEPPFFQTENMGSLRHAQLLKSEKVDVRLMISLECIGFYSDGWNSQKYPVPALKLMYPWRGDFIAIVGAASQRGAVRRVKKHMKGATSLPVYSIAAPSLVPAIDFSDHWSYWQTGYNAVMVTDTAFLRNQNYHGPTDTHETLDYGRMAKAVVAVFEAVTGIAREEGLRKTTD